MTEVTRDQYFEAIKGKELELWSTFTDSEGTHPLGYGCPSSDTEWGVNDKVFCRMETRTRNDIETIRYFLTK